MTLWRSHLMLLAVASCLPSFASQDMSSTPKDVSEEWIYFVDWRPLEGEELRLYLEVRSAIQRITPEQSLDDVVESTVNLVSHVENLPSVVAEPTKRSLQRQLSSHLHDTFEPLENLVLKLIAMDKAETQIVALDALKPFATDRELDALPAVANRLVALLRNDETDSDVRVSILGTFFIDHYFDRIRPIAEALARSLDPEVARSAAFYVCAAMLDEEFDSEYVTTHFRAESSILRQEAALALLRFDHDRLSGALKDEVIDEVLAIIADEDLPPITRGEAIDEARHLIEEDRVRQAVLTLLQRDNWFFGVRDNHGPGHSLVIVLETLAWAEAPAVTKQLRRFRGELEHLSDVDRPPVESALDRATRTTN